MIDLNTKPGYVPVLLAQLALQYEELDRRSQEEGVGKEIVNKVQTIGRTAAWFGGFDAMKKLHDAAEETVGNNNSVGYHLNWMWDGIGGWWA